MVKRVTKYTVVVLLGAVLVYHSIYFKSLQAVKAAAKGFDIDQFAKEYLFEMIPKYNSHFVDMMQLRKVLQQDAAEAFKSYSHAANDGEVRYFMVRGAGLVTRKDGSFVWVEDVENNSMKLAAEYIYGTAARDAAGLVVVDSFDNTMVFNELSEKINYLIKKEKTPVLKSLSIGDEIHFIGALELSQKTPRLADAEIIPLYLGQVQNKRR